MLIYIAHRRRKTCNVLDTLVLSEQECFQWTSERLVTTHCYVGLCSIKCFNVSLEMLLTAQGPYICNSFVSHHAGRVMLNGKVSTGPLRKW